MNPNDLYIWSIQRSPTISAMNALAVNWLLTNHDGYSGWRDGELHNGGWVSELNGEELVPRWAASQMLDASRNIFFPLPQEFQPRCAMLNIPDRLTRPWCQHISAVCKYYTMEHGKYALLHTAFMLQHAPNQTSNNSIHAGHQNALSIWNSWNPHLRQIRARVNNMVVMGTHL